MQIALNTDPGFDYAHTITVDPALYAHAFEPPAAREYLAKLEERVSQVPGVESVTLVLNPPMGTRASVHACTGQYVLMFISIRCGRISSALWAFRSCEEGTSLKTIMTWW